MNMAEVAQIILHYEPQPVSAALGDRSIPQARCWVDDQKMMLLWEALLDTYYAAYGFDLELIKEEYGEKP